MASDFFTMRELIARAFSRYLRVVPGGLQLSPDRIVPSLSARILAFRPARTLYINRKPVCRSLDGIHSLTKGRTCASCTRRKTCTPQICLELLYEGIPLRLMLAYTSAKNFLCFVSTLRKKGLPVENATVLITVRDRGRWGELCFTCASPRQNR